MANNNLNSENILVKVDQNNLIYIDPNSVLDNDGNVVPRAIKQEELVTFVNLEADLVPRTTLLSDGKNSNIVSIAKGKLNFLKSSSGNGNFDTSWTDSFNPMSYDTVNRTNAAAAVSNYFSKGKQTNYLNYTNSDSSGQSFGITSVNIVIKGANFIPQVNIDFVDVRGKTLFESPENSPYKAFFHLPWPIFYLTVKGYYGKAIRYRLHLTKFKSSYNETNGNFEIKTSFVGSTYAYLADMPLQAVIHAPYMFGQTIKKTENQFNGETTKTFLSKTSRGYSILKSVYTEYKQKGLIPKDFPNMTIIEMSYIAQTLDKLLEQEIFDRVVDMEVLLVLKEFSETITNFDAAINNWAQRNLSKNESIPHPNWKDSGGKPYFGFRLIQNKESTINVLGKENRGTLENILSTAIESLNKTSNLYRSIEKKKTDFGNFTLNYSQLNNVKNYYENDGNVLIYIQKIYDDIYKLKQSYDEQKKKVEDVVELEMNKIVRGKNGFGFEPTIRNIFAVICASADVFIKIMKDIHRRAFNASNDRKKKLSQFASEQQGEPIFPWPQIRKKISDGSQNVAAYPGDVDLIKKLNSDNKTLWPEVDFIEDYISVVTNYVENNKNKENYDTQIVFETDVDINNINRINTIDVINQTFPYNDKNIASFLHELHDRAKYFTLIESFDNETLKNLAKYEVENILNAIKEEDELIDIITKINNKEQFDEVLKGISPYERYPYYIDQIPTTSYINESLNSPYLIEHYPNSKKFLANDTIKKDLDDRFINYIPESYRDKIFPFSSDVYKNYIGKKYSLDDLKLSGKIKVDTVEGFTLSDTSPSSWVKSQYRENIFNKKIFIGNTSTNILNTSYFHNQLREEFDNNKTYGKYAGSAYLLLNSLGFIDLNEKIDDKILTSSLFREIGSTHLIPYHLIIKWGAIYHRYKTKIIDNIDILQPFLNSQNRTKKIDTNKAFNNSTSSVFEAHGKIIDKVKDIGVHPMHDAIFCQIINGFVHFDAGNLNSNSYKQNIDLGRFESRPITTSNGFNYWTSFVDNSKYVPNSNKFTLLPSEGYHTQPVSRTNDFSLEEQTNFNIIWDDSLITNNIDDLLFPNTNEYCNNLNTNEFSLDTNYKKIIDLIGTFSPFILEEFENEFLKFASDKPNYIDGRDNLDNIQYKTFQDLLLEVCTVDKKDNEDILTFTQTAPIEVLLTSLKDKQNKKLKVITSKILSNDNLIKLTIVNPKEIDPYIYNGFINETNEISLNGYNNSELLLDENNLIKLYIGEDIDGISYRDFFDDNNISITDESVLAYRSLAMIYAGYIKSGGQRTTTSFKNYLKVNIYTNKNKFTFGADLRYDVFISYILNKLSQQKIEKESNQNVIRNNSFYNGETTKLELYNTFKSFNDKWVAGNSLGQRLLFEEFMFLDIANKDIGDKVFMDLQKIPLLTDIKHSKIDLYTAISGVLAGSGLTIRALPAYVNFYGNNFLNKNKITPSKSVAKNLFGTYLEVDYQESSPKILIQLVGQSSKHLADLSTRKKPEQFIDDSFPIYLQNNNPLLITSLESFSQVDLSKSNRVVAFEVSIGDQNQNIFKGVTLNQDTIRNTSESFRVLEQLARSESGTGAATIDVNLFDYYKQASYTCEVTCLGNVMIQPTMFFYLKNVPLFRGSYWILDVTHTIRDNTVMTMFTGTRIPYSSLPDPKDSFVSTYRALFDKIANKAISILKGVENLSTTQSIITTNGSSQVDVINNKSINIPNEKIVNTLRSYYKPEKYNLPYNGKDGSNIILVENHGKQLFKAFVVTMGGTNFEISDDKDMSVLDKLSTKPTNGKIKWKDVKNLDVYTTNVTIKLADKMVNNGSITFVDINSGKELLNVKSVFNNNTLSGIVHHFEAINNFGVGLSPSLMKKLKLRDGDLIYFTLE